MFFSISLYKNVLGIQIIFSSENCRIPPRSGHIAENSDSFSLMKLYYIRAYQRDFFTGYVFSFALSNKTIFSMKFDV